MKLSIDDLRVDSYATQVSENELTEVKGGTTPICVLAVVAVLVLDSCAARKAEVSAQQQAAIRDTTATK